MSQAVEFDKRYKEGETPWDIKGVQAPFENITLNGKIIDLGCGTGELTLYAASKGCDVTGFELSPTAIKRAREKMGNRGVSARFIQGDILQPSEIGEKFNTLLDSALFHTFGPKERPNYLNFVNQISEPGSMLYLLCFSDKEQASDPPPYSLSEEEIKKTFEKDWDIHMQPSKIEVLEEYQWKFSDDGPHAWFVTMTKK